MPTVLVISRASHDTFFPDLFELPTGTVERSDEAMFETLARGLLEETGLMISSLDEVRAQIGSFQHETGKVVEGPWPCAEVVRESTLQLNFIVRLKKTEKVKLNPSLHTEYRWVSATEIEGLMMTELMKDKVEKMLFWELINTPAGLYAESEVRDGPFSLHHLQRMLTGPKEGRGSCGRQGRLVLGGEEGESR